MKERRELLFMVDEDRRALLPCNASAEKALAELMPGYGVAISFPEPASHRDLRKHVFGVLGRLAKATNTDADAVRIALLLRTGRCHFVSIPLTTDGAGTQATMVAVVDSMARQFMDEDELRSFYHDMREIIRDSMLDAISEPERSEIAAIIDA
jgi:hypothetical protein